MISVIGVRGVLYYSMGSIILMIGDTVELVMIIIGVTGA